MDMPSTERWPNLRRSKGATPGRDSTDRDSTDSVHFLKTRVHRRDGTTRRFRSACQSGRSPLASGSVGNLINGGSAQSSLLTTIVSLDPIHAHFAANEREVLNYMRMVSAGDRENSRAGDYRNPVFMRLSDAKG